MRCSLRLEDEAATMRLGEDLALALRAGDLLALSGDLGAGKSTLARAFLRALADDADLEVPSPTFTLVQSYPLRIPAAHFDLYRLSGPDELEELGFEEALSEGICLVEWPERAQSALPVSRIHVTLTHEGDGRRVEIEAQHGQAERIKRTLDIRSFLQADGRGDARRRYLTGDASVRAYEYIPTGGESRLILMDWPKPPEGPAVLDGKPYHRVAHIAQDAWPFIAVAEALGRRGFAVPDVLLADCDRGILLLSDLGRDGILDGQGAPVEERYRQSVLALAMLHAAPFTPEIHVKRPDCGDHVHHVPAFDPTAMAMEVRLLLDWYMPWKTGASAEEGLRQRYLTLWQDLILQLADSEKNLLLRDFHSPNIVWRGQEDGLKRVGILDFQDAMIGPTSYDVASLVQDARVTIAGDMGDRLLTAYISARHQQSAFDEDRFRHDYAIMAAQRACKLAGLWVRLMQRDGKAHYMQHMPRTLAYLRAALEHQALTPLRDWCREAGIGLFES